MFLTKSILDWLLPEICVSCGKENTTVCVDCISKMHPKTTIIKKPTALLDSVIVCLDLNNTIVQKIVHAFKYSGVQSLSDTLSTILANSITPYSQLPYALVPIPLHPRREARRGYNQSLLLAQELSRITRLPIATILQRKQFTQQQAKLSESERTQNLMNAFVCTEAPPRNVLLIDDVATTFSTLNAAAAALKRRGCKTISGIVLAKKLLH